MEVNQKLNVEAKEFFNALATSVAYDISQATGKKVNPDQVYSGFRYKKKMKNKMGQENHVDVMQASVPPMGRMLYFTRSKIVKTETLWYTTGRYLRGRVLPTP